MSLQASHGKLSFDINESGTRAGCAPNCAASAADRANAVHRDNHAANKIQIASESEIN